MGNFLGKTPKWISKEPAGKNPAYGDQANPKLKLEKDLDKELSLLDQWKKAEVGDFSSKGGTDGSYTFGEWSAVDNDGKTQYEKRLGRPYIVSIQGVSEEVEYRNTSAVSNEVLGVVGADLFTSWVECQGDRSKYKISIPYKFHRKGLIKGRLEEDNYGDIIHSADNFVIPKVKVYSFMNEDATSYQIGEVEFEEVYDSASVNIRDGNITIYSDISNPICLVVIY